MKAIRYLIMTILLLGVFCSRARAEKIGTLTRILGAESMRIEGEGIITGLNGTGDKSSAALKLIRNYLEAHHYSLSLDDLSSRNIALVRVDAEIPAFVRPGQKINVRVSSINDASSLANGVLKMCALRFRSDGPVIMRSSGRVTVGGTLNPTTGIITDGGVIENHEMLNRDIIDADNSFRLILKRKSFTDAAAISQAINTDQTTNPYQQELYDFEGGGGGRRVARALDAGAVIVTIPDTMLDKKVEYISTVLNLDTAVEQKATILLDRQSGAAVITGNVQITPGFISYRDRTVNLTPVAERKADQPKSYRLRDEDNRSLVSTQGPGRSGTRSLQALVDTLNAMGTTTDDLIVIFNKLRTAGILHADVIVE